MLALTLYLLTRTPRTPATTVKASVFAMEVVSEQSRKRLIVWDVMKTPSSPAAVSFENTLRSPGAANVSGMWTWSSTMPRKKLGGDAAEQVMAASSALAQAGMVTACCYKTVGVNIGPWMCEYMYMHCVRLSTRHRAP